MLQAQMPGGSVQARTCDILSGGEYRFISVGIPGLLKKDI